MRTVTFYSYKGGVGRSLAIANVACVLARDYGKRVLLVDWDLEAPGLHRFFGLESESLGPGLMDILDDYKALLTKDIEVLPEQLVKLDKYINTAGMPSYRSGGSVALVGAGTATMRPSAFAAPAIRTAKTRAMRQVGGKISLAYLGTADQAAVWGNLFALFEE